MRVIFDRSAFHGERFRLLEASALQRLVVRGRVTVLHTPIFIEETISTYGSARCSGEWRRHLEFAADICNGGLFLARDEICRNELVRDKGLAAAHLMSRKGTKHSRGSSEMIEQLGRVARTGDLDQAWADSRAERDDTQRKKSNQRKIFAEIRRDIAKGTKARRIKGDFGAYPFAELRAVEFESAGISLMRTVDERRAAALAAKWAKYPVRYPYYSAFVEGLLYAQYYAAIKQNARLDRNAQADIEQLAYLLWADVIVSNDEGFFRSTFEELWATRAKTMKSAESFVERLARLERGGHR